MSLNTRETPNYELSPFDETFMKQQLLQFHLGFFLGAVGSLSNQSGDAKAAAVLCQRTQGREEQWDCRTPPPHILLTQPFPL